MKTTGENHDVDLDAYRNYMLARGLSSNTIGQRADFARARWAEWGCWPTSGAVIATWLERWQGWTKWTYHGHLKSLYGWLVADGLAAENPLLLIRRPPRPRPRPRPLTETELRRALETAPRDVGDWLLLGYLAGLRSHEIAKFRGEEISEHGIYILGKGGQSWMIPTHPLLWQLAQSYPRSGYWFPSPLKNARAGQPVSPITVTNKVSRHFTSLGISGATHRARHTYATQLLRDGANLRVVQELLRHASLATTALYLGIDEEEKRAAIGRLSWAA